MKKINELRTGQKDVTTIGKIVELSPVKTFQRMGSPGKVVVAVLEDDTGKINLTLWDDDAELYKLGDVLKVENCSVSEFRGIMQLKTGRTGSLKKLEELPLEA